MPWGRLDDSLYDHPKLDLIPAGDRLAAVGLWARAISWCNRFLTDGHVPRARVEKLDGTIQLADQLVAAGLFDADATGYRVHDFLEFNDSRADVLERRAKEAARKAEWRRKGKNERPGGTTDGTSRSDDGDVPPSVPPSVPPGHGGMSRPESRRLSRRDSRARARSANPDPTRPDPTHESESGSSDVVYPAPAPKGPVSGMTRLGDVEWATAMSTRERDAWSTYGPEWGGFRDAWLSRGLRRPPAGSPDDDPEATSPSQRAILWSILDARPRDLPRWVAEAPPRASASQVVAYCLERWHGTRDQATDRATADEAAWDRGKSAERDAASGRLEELQRRAEAIL